MNGFSKKIILAVLCALSVCAGGFFAFSAVRIQTDRPKQSAPAAQTAVGVEKEQTTVSQTAPPEKTSSPDPQSTAAAETASASTETAPDAAETAPAATNETTGAAETTASGASAAEKSSLLSLPAAAQTTEAEEKGVTVIDRFRLKESKIMSVRENTKVTDYLAAMGDAHAYMFSTTSRGVLQIGFHFGVSEFSGTPWVIYLYEAYSENGEAENDAWRLLTRLDITSGDAEITKTEKIGIYPGDYALIVTTGDVYSAADYTLMAAFVTNAPWEAEPNNSRTRYNELAAGVRTGGSSSNTLASDQDWYLIEMPAPGYISVLFEHEKLGGVSVGWFLTLMNERGETIFRQRSNLQDAETTSGEIGLDAGYYYLNVEPNVRQDADYFITCERVLTDEYEKELNEASETANEIPISDRTNRISGSLAEKDGTPDRDCYRFTLPSDGVISFTFLHKDLLRPRDGWRIILKDAAGEELFRTTSRWIDTTVASPQIGLSAGTYYICVDGEDMLYTNETYTINVTFVAGKNWESENNDTAELADPVEPGVIRYGTLVSAGLEFDTDYYAFSVQKTSAVTLTFSHNTVSGEGEGWVVSLADEKGTVLTSFASMLETRSVTSALVNLAPGRYYIRIDAGTRFSDAKYGVTVNFK